MRRWPLGIACTLAATSVFVAWGLWRNAIGGRSLPEELAGARREGLAVEPRDLIEPSVPDAENGAIPYLRAAKLARELREKTRWRSKLEAILMTKDRYPKSRLIASLSPAERKRLATLLALEAPAIAALREAGARPSFVLNRPWHRPYGIDLDDIRMFGFLIETVGMRATLREVEGDYSGAYDDLRLAARATGIFHYGITEYDHYTRRRSEEKLLERAVRMAGHRASDHRIPPLLRELVHHLGPPPDLHRIYRSQIVASRRELAYRSEREATSIRLRSVREATEAKYVAYWRTLHRSLPTDPLAFDAARAAVVRTNQEFHNRDDWSIISAYIDIVPSDIDQLAQNEARRKMTLAISDVLESYQRQGHWPKALPNPYPDPFGGKIRYRVDKDGFIVYSLDANHQDDNGDEETATRSARDNVLRIRIANGQ